MILWEDLSFIALDRRASDHCTLVLRDKIIDYGPKPFKVLDEWWNKEGVDKIIIDAWGKSVSSWKNDCSFRDKLKNVKNDLKSWCKGEFSNIDNEIKQFELEVNKWELLAEQGGLDSNQRKCWLDTRKKWLDKEKVKSNMLRQKARVKWILEGDENTKYFHSSIRRKYSKCNIRGLNINGSWCENSDVVKPFIMEYFRDVFKEKNFNRPNFINCLGRPDPSGPVSTGPADLGGYHLPVYSDNGPFGPPRPAPPANGSVSNSASDTNHHTSLNRISKQEAESLEAKFCEEEIWGAINDCGSSKVPGPDGFNIGGCNASFITLIPKVSDLIYLKEYRLISLIGSFYKILAKLLSNLLKKVIPNLVNFEQSGFIKGRNIMDGALIANETISFLKNNRRKSLVFKVDFEKTFDCLNWEYLEEIMSIIGFGKRWIKWILYCLNIATVSVLVNGSCRDPS
ncbi:uncharacterized protein [Rutidosis leptorrhynchoides]|uniref:uncharacterized protein n=1 Tax=Rutidosis leptorrhynchoides TaxID=125765 RepID=UPI003A9A2879